MRYELEATCARRKGSSSTRAAVCADSISATALGDGPPRRGAGARRSRARCPSRGVGRPETRRVLCPTRRWASGSGSGERSGRDAGYAGAVEGVRAAIGRGDVYQVNLVQHLSAPFDGEPRADCAALLADFAPTRLGRRRLGDRLRLAGALPRPPRPAGLDVPDQGHAPARGARRGREGRSRARDDRRPRAKRSLAGLRAGHACAGRS